MQRLHHNTAVSIYLGLGSNVGDREASLRGVVKSLADRDIKVWRSASLYSTEPRDFEDQPWFLNTVIEVRTLLEPEPLLRQCLEIEVAAGRIRGTPKGPRVLDVDILLYKERILEVEGLKIPHPRYRDRRFVLVPLVELAPDLADPASSLTMRQLLDLCPDKGEVHLAGKPLL
jgi:2-amino-4-hydroxy-6-hydroxymethyldihydropteridine diphosphokinase